MATTNDSGLAPRTRSPNETMLIEALNACSLGQEVMGHLNALFLAIREATDKHTNAHQLASIGTYLSSDLGNTFDCQREDLNDALKGITADCGVGQ